MKPRLLIVTEASLEFPNTYPLSKLDEARVNGVYRTYENFLPHLKEHYDVDFLTPFDYGAEKSIVSGLLQKNVPFPAPMQNTIRIVIPSKDDIAKRFKELKPDHVHLATEGPLGFAAMKYAKAHGISTSTAFHTNWQQYVLEKGFSVPLLPKNMVGDFVKNLLTKFHKQADAVMSATPELTEQIVAWGLDPKKIHLVSRGINPAIFHRYPDSERPVKDPYIICVGRLAPGKGVDRFCELDAKDMHKVVVGTGPISDQLRAKYPDTIFAGFIPQKDLGRYYSGAEFFVLPSDTETYGMTVTEALASGTPVVALNRGGHQPILNLKKGLGIMDGNLQTALDNALAEPNRLMDRDDIAAFMEKTHSWKAETDKFIAMVEATMTGEKSRKAA